MSTPSSPASALAGTARAAALAVAPYLRAAVRTVDSFETKTDFHDPVTVHDTAVEGALRTILATAVPGSRVLGEETGASALDPATASALPAGIGMPTGPEWDAARAALDGFGARVRWIVDPIDGTANFASGLAWFNTSIGCELDGEVVAGVVCAPLLGELFLADDSGAVIEDEEGVRPIDARGPKEESRAVINTYYPGARALLCDPEAALERERRIIGAFQSTRRLGAAALDLAYVAAGRLGAMMGTNFKPWDVAAGIFILRAAGGNALNVDLGTDLPDGLRPGVVASGAGFLAPTARAVMLEVAGSWTR